ncbi:MAG: FecR domain-containing protein [Candidatus Competibacteraceae bacterium]|nr:FecR domain-containing protein [Candidatus Competibacteraceae bacterium]
MLRLSQYLSLFMTLWLWTVTGYAERPPDIAGYVTRVRGEVVIENAAGRRSLALGQPLHIDDRIVTGAKARLEARMQDGTILTLGANTEFLIRQVQGVSPKDSGSLFELFKGVFRAATTQARAEAPTREDWRVQTPVATIGIRGTELWGGFNLLDAGSDTLDVVMLKGKGVYVESAGQRVELQQAGEGTTVESAGQTPMPAKAWGEEKVQAAFQTVMW